MSSKSQGANRGNKFAAAHNNCQVYFRVLFCSSRNTQYKKVIKLKEALAIHSAEQQDTNSALPAKVGFIVADRDMPHVGSCKL